MASSDFFKFCANQIDFKTNVEIAFYFYFYDLIVQMLDRNMNELAHNKNKTFFLTLTHSIDFLLQTSRTEENFRKKHNIEFFS